MSLISGILGSTMTKNGIKSCISYVILEDWYKNWIK